MVEGRLDFTDEARRVMRGHANGMLLLFGPPHLFITINWSDLSNPLVVYLLGKQVDLSLSAPDLPVNLPSLRERAVLLAKPGGRRPVLPHRRSLVPQEPHRLQARPADAA